MSGTFGTLLNFRLHFAADMNLDGAVTISDVWLWFKWLYFLPGDVLLLMLLDTSVGNFFEITLSSLQNWGSGVFSFFGWLVVFGMVALASETSGTQS